MTRINKVVLAGFKSFQKRTVIPFFDGLTAIVGENGSGKSNLFDAISFVMGRRSSQLRADRLEHLIFNGGERHAPSEEAEVVLHLDNTGGVFNRFLEDGDRAPEVTIGRRITRKSSTYLFMGKGCPRELVDQVLEEARVDPDGQQLIAQGRITDVVRRSPLRRREILDEVSGIAAYDDQRRQAIDELKDVKSKLNTHRVVLAERRRRLVALERERDAALEHQCLTEEQGRLADSIRHLKRERVVERLARARAERGGMVGQTEGLEEEIKRLDLAIENKEWELEGMRDEAGGPGEVTLVKEVERLRAGITQKGMEIDLKRQQAKSLQEMIDEVARMKAAEATRAAEAPTASRAVQALLARKRGGIYGTVASLATPRTGFEVAFETAAGGSLSDLVVDSRETALECIAYLKENRLGRVRMLPLGRLVTPHKSVASADALKLPRVVDYAINLVGFDPKYRRAFEYVLTDTVVAETSTGCVSSLSTGTSKARAEPSPEGLALSRPGSRSSRETPPSTRRASARRSSSSPGRWSGSRRRSSSCVPSSRRRRRPSSIRRPGTARPRVRPEHGVRNCVPYERHGARPTSAWRESAATWYATSATRRRRRRNWRPSGQRTTQRTTTSQAPSSTLSVGLRRTSGASGGSNR